MDDSRSVLGAELAAVRGELTRVDGKCGTLAGLAGAATAFLATQVTGAAPWPMRTLLAAAGVVLATATLVLLLAVLRPRLGTTGFCRYATLPDEDLHALFDPASPTPPAAQPVIELTELKVLSTLVRRKYLRLRVAVDLIALGVVLIAASVAVAVIA